MKKVHTVWASLVTFKKNNSKFFTIQHIYNNHLTISHYVDIHILMKNCCGYTCIPQMHTYPQHNIHTGIYTYTELEKYTCMHGRHTCTHTPPCIKCIQAYQHRCTYTHFHAYRYTHTHVYPSHTCVWHRHTHTPPCVTCRQLCFKL